MITMITATTAHAPITTAPLPKRGNLLLHCGSHAGSRNELAQTLTPPATSTWQPIAYHKLLQLVERTLLENGFTITGQAHGLTHDCARYFGLIEISGLNHHPDYHYIVGVRNSHDMRFSAGLVAGSQVLVCDNLSFSG